MAAYTTIDDPEAYFQTVLYTANQTADTTITLPGDTNMQPDLVWIKNRENSVKGHRLFDSTRGVTKLLTSNNDGTETTATETLTAFTSDGFTLGDDVDGSTYYGVNWETGDGMVAWCWNTQGGAGSSNTAGSINTTTTSVGTTQGFSISTYTGNATAGATIGHGLGAVPSLMIVKNRDDSQNWRVYHHKNTAAPETDNLELNNTTATVDTDERWNDTAPTSTLLTLGSTGSVNQDGDKHVAYVWTGIQGYSKFGSYTGNGDTDGTFVYTGFRPALIIIKRTDVQDNWNMYDSKRGYNPENAYIKANATTAEASDVDIDILSNGFKSRTADAAVNVGDGVYVYIAFAEAPFVNSEGVPCNAR